MVQEWDTLSTFQKIRNLRTQLVTAFGVAFLNFNIGISLAFTAQAEQSMSKEFNLSVEDYSWVGGLMPFGGFVGTLVAGPIVTFGGRKCALITSALGIFIAWFFVVIASGVRTIFACRFFIGFFIGITSATAPIYLGEILQAEIRGALLLLPTIIGNTGIMVTDALGKFLLWRQLSIACNCGPLIFLLCFSWILPESPRWLLLKGKDDKFKKNLRWLRGPDYNVEKEIDDILKWHNEVKQMNVGIREIFVITNLMPIGLIVMLMFFQQFSGVNAIIFYSTKIFRAAGKSIIDPTFCTTIIGISDFFSTFTAATIVDRFGRKLLMYVSASVIIVVQTTLGIYFNWVLTEDKTNYSSLIPLIGLIFFVFGFSFGFGPIPWLLMAEVLPFRIRGYGAGIGAAMNWFGTFIVTKTFMPLAEKIGLGNAFFLCELSTVTAIFFVYFVVPDTRGKTLEDIEMRAGDKQAEGSS